jgi:hypothetical protein
MKKWLVAALVVLSISPAYADHGWGWRGDWIGPALVGGVIAYDLTAPYRYYPYSYGYPYPAYSAPPVYVAPAQAAPQYWYFCASANRYYPYVANCPEGWKAVPAQPPQ